MNRFLGLLLLFGGCSHVNAQDGSSPLTQSGAPQARRQSEVSQPKVELPVVLGAVRAVQDVPAGMELQCENGRLEVTALQDDVIRVRATRAARFPAKYSYAVLPVPAGAPQSVNAQVLQTPNAAELRTRGLRVRVDRQYSIISFVAADNTLIARDAAPIVWKGEAFSVTKEMPPDEHYFGLGDKPGPLDHRNQAFTMWNTDAYGWQESTDPLYKALGFVLALNKGM